MTNFIRLIRYNAFEGDFMKKNKKGKKLRRIFFLIILIVTYVSTLKLLNKINLDVKNESFYQFLINNSSTLTLDNPFSYNNFKQLINFKPNQLLASNLIYENDDEIPISKNEEGEVTDDNTDSLEDPIEPVISRDPTVYIYNTHQTETYSSKYLTDYSITPDVMMASYMLKEDLEDYGIYAYVEEDSVSKVLNKNKWPYYKSYVVTRDFMEKRKEELPTLKYFIDVHRDSVKKQYTTTTINGNNYAKIMLLIGLEHDNYKVNLKEAKKINEKLNQKYPGISRGIYKKSGPGVNGIYNQDFSKFVFLFEVGGVDNDISEVNNSITALADVLAEYIKETGSGTN